MKQTLPDNLALNYEGFFLMAQLSPQSFGLSSWLGSNYGANALGQQNLVPSNGIFGLNTTPASSIGAETGTSNFRQGLGGASVGLAIGQAIGGMYSAWKGGKTTKYVMQKQAEIAEANRQMAQLSAESAMRQGEAQVAQLTYRAGQIKAKQRTAFASNGVRLGTGSTAEVAASTDIMKEIDKSTAEMNALSAAWGYKQQALQASAQGGIFSATASYAKAAKQSEGFSSVLEGGFSAADRWYRYFGAS